MSGLPVPRLTSKQLLEAANAERHAAIRASINAMSVEEQADAAARIVVQARLVERERPQSVPKDVGKRLPLAARIATADPDRMINIPVFEADVANFTGRDFDAERWITWVIPQLEADGCSNVHRNTVMAAVVALAKAASGGKGMAQWAYDQWGKFANCCGSTIHKIIRPLWGLGLLRIANVFYWHDHTQRRASQYVFSRDASGSGGSRRSRHGRRAGAASTGAGVGSGRV